MATVELRPLIGQYHDTAAGKLRSKQWKDIEKLYLNGRQIATINTVPGSMVTLIPGTPELTAGEKEAVASAIAAARGGVRPKQIGPPVGYEILDDDEGADTELEDDDE